MWRPNFLSIVKITEKGVMLSDSITKEFVYVNDLDNVNQFELDGRFREFQPHCHYEVRPDFTSASAERKGPNN